MLVFKEIEAKIDLKDETAGRRGGGRKNVVPG